MSIKIKSIGGRVLYTAESAADVRAAVVEAAKRRADLSGADLSGADLSGADLSGAYLSRTDFSGAYLSGADLSGADLSGAYLRRAYLSGADLSGAYLRRAYLSEADRRSPLYAFRADIWEILDAAPKEVAALRAKLVAGEINGSAYAGECACLVGTIAQAHEDLEGSEDDETAVFECARSLGIVPDASRPAEQWFMAIRPGDVPLAELPELPPFERSTKVKLPDGWPSEGVYRASLVLRWIDSWVVSRAALVKALTA